MSGLSSKSREKENNHKDKIFIPKSNVWIASALLSSLLFAASNFLLSMYSQKVVNTREFSHIGTFIFTISYLLVIKVLSSKDHWFNVENSIFYDKNKKQINNFVIGGVILSTILQISSGYWVLFAMEYSQWADINKGVITTFFSFTSVLMAIYSWFMFNEKLSEYNIFGIIWMIVCISMLGFAESSPKNIIQVIDKEEQWTAFYSISFGILTCVFFCLRIIINKGIILKFKVNSNDINVASQFLWGLIFTFLFFYRHKILEVDPIFMLIWISGGIINCIALLLIYHAYSIGYVGPATALSGLTPIPHTIASSIYSSKLPSNYQIGWMLIGIFGCIVVSVGPFLSEKLSKKKKY